MPIKGLSEQRRLPRLGKIHLGYKKLSERSGKEYPVATEYFVIPRELEQYLGIAPTEIPIMIPVEDDEIWANQYYKSYSRTRGLTCRGDGVTCRRMIDNQTGAKADRESKEIVWKDLECQGRQCPDYIAKECKETMNLQFIMPDIPGLGIWQVDTSSINSIRNINSAAEMIRAVYKRIAFIPLILTLEPQEVVNPDDGKKKTVRCLHLRARGTLRDLMIEAAKPVTELLLPGPVEDEAPLDTEAADETASVQKARSGGASTQIPIISQQADLPKIQRLDPSAGALPAPAASTPPIDTKPATPAPASPPAAVEKPAAPPIDTKPAAVSKITPEPGKPSSTGKATPKTDTRTASRKFVAELKKANMPDDEIMKILLAATGKKAGWTAEDITKARAFYEAQVKENLEKDLNKTADAADAFLKEQGQS